MKFHSISRKVCCTAPLLALLMLAPALRAQNPPAQAAEEPEQPLRSRVFIFDLRDGSSHQVYTADSIWEAPNWSPDGKYLLLNSGGMAPPSRRSCPFPPSMTATTTRNSLRMAESLLSRQRSLQARILRSFWPTRTAAASNE
jgi:hypothetical protein